MRSHFKSLLEIVRRERIETCEKANSYNFSPEACKALEERLKQSQNVSERGMGLQQGAPTVASQMAGHVVRSSARSGVTQTQSASPTFVNEGNPAGSEQSKAPETPLANEGSSNTEVERQRKRVLDVGSSQDPENKTLGDSLLGTIVNWFKNRGSTWDD